MSLTNLIIFFISGLIIGSFLNVVIFRLNDLKSIINDRSRCRHCNLVIEWFDLIPVLSFILLRGRCRSCGNKISWQYPVIELSTAIVFASLYAVHGFSGATFYYLLVYIILIIVAGYDLLTQYVPEFFVWLALALSLLGWYFGGFSITNALIGALIGGGVLAILVLASKEKWMGSGDIKIGLILGLLTGFPVAIFGLFASFILGSVVGLIYVFAAKKSLKSSLPFAPFLIMSSYIAIIYGKPIVDWYLGKVFF